LFELLDDAAPPSPGPVGPKVLLGVLDEAGAETARERRPSRKIILAIAVVILGAALAAILELTRALPVRTEVPLKMVDNLLVVPVEINGALTLDFTIDSGASNVVIPANIFALLKRAGTIKEADILGQHITVLADGSERLVTGFRINSLKVGDIVVRSVEGSVVSSQGSLLLGQSFLGRFKSWSLDNASRELLLDYSTSDWRLILRRLSDIGCEKMIRLSKWAHIAQSESICTR
jgi:hypothetical protein